MHALASQPNPLGLLGAIYIIEGHRPAHHSGAAAAVRRQLDLPEQAFRFLAYHGDNDAHTSPAG